MTDRELLREFAKRGSERAFQSLAQRHVDLVFATALRLLSDAGAAQEITQNVFIVLARKAAWLRGEVSLAGWLHKTAMLEARQWWRGELRRQRREQTAIELGTTMKDDDSLLKSFTGVLDEGLMELRDSDRQALLLRYFGDRSHREVGTLLGVGEDAARKRIEKALDQLTRFFRRRGYTVSTMATAASVLRGSANVAPVGLAATVTKIAVSAGGAASLTGFSLLFANFMGLTKTQIVAVCLLVASLPIAYEWRAEAGTRAEQRVLRTQLDRISGDLAARLRSLDQTQRRLLGVESALARIREDIAGQRSQTVVPSVGEPNLYLWSEESEYVRVPKALAKELTLSGSHSSALQGDGRKQRTYEPVLVADGSLSAPLKEALAVTPEEEVRLRDTFQIFQSDYREMAQYHSFPTNSPPAGLNVGDRDSRTLVTVAFREEGEALKQRLRSSLEATLGNERAEIVWQQARNTFVEEFNDFGTMDKFETVTVGPDKSVWYAQEWRPRGETHSSRSKGISGQLRANDVPEVFRPFVAEWLKRGESKP